MLRNSKQTSIKKIIKLTWKQFLLKILNFTLMLGNVQLDGSKWWEVVKKLFPGVKKFQKNPMGLFQVFLVCGGGEAFPGVWYEIRIKHYIAFFRFHIFDLFCNIWSFFRAWIVTMSLGTALQVDSFSGEGF